MCSWVPSNLNVDVTSCPVVWSGHASQSNSVSKALEGPGNIPVDPITFQATSTPLAAPSSQLSLSSASSSMPTPSLDLLATSASTVHTHVTVTVLVIPQPSTIASTEDDDDDDDDEYQVRLFHFPFQCKFYAATQLRPRDVQIIPSQEDQPVSVTLVGLTGKNNTVLDDSCLWSLNWPVSVYVYTKFYQYHCSLYVQ